MAIDTTRFVTADGHPYRVIAEDLPGPLPVLIVVNNEVAYLNADLVCPANNGYNLTEARRNNTRYFSVYRAADGAFTLGRRAWTSDDQRRSTRDSQRAIAAIALTYDENSRQFSINTV